MTALRIFISCICMAFAIGAAPAIADPTTTRALSNADRIETALKVQQIAYEIRAAFNSSKTIVRACRHASVRLKQVGFDFYDGDLSHPLSGIGQHVENCCRTHFYGEIGGTGGRLLEFFANPLPKLSRNKRAAALAKAEKIAKALGEEAMTPIYREIGAIQAASRKGFQAACAPVVAFDLLAP